MGSGSFFGCVPFALLPSNGHTPERGPRAFGSPRNQNVRSVGLTSSSSRTGWCWKDGVMIEEWLFWDNATYRKQIGIGQ
jgi:hypothetical protein